ncbi:MAG: hypothetical protein AUJ49_03445 [Desulfovibrionaceae bacterium CG1_02_65_16]|nr:MAG: hypothetical protein AUJ49_03445 [Desulfovibrionaceae bacterium CG1_02_65_16]
MPNGVFLVTFQSSLATVGEAIAVCDACGVHGANESHAFRGRQEDDGARMVLELRHLCGERYPAFGQLPALTLELEVTQETPEGFRAAGTIREASGIRLAVVAKKLCELAD